ncbi:unnamed protein product [Rotaria sp. Silwood1]|nr:unnamed protein product [Rotaria sp. Silwood1]
MKFELLPNEIFIETFEFFRIFDIFYSFNQLNDHFNKLIGTIPSHFNFKYIQKTRFDRFCKLLLSNLDVKNQVYSLVLSNKDTPVEENILQKLKSTLPLIPQLHSFHLLDSNDIHLTHPLISNLQILSIPTLSSINNLS